MNLHFLKSGITLHGQGHMANLMIDQRRRAGQTVRAFCHEKDISEPSFYAWQRKLKQRATALRSRARQHVLHRTLTLR